jgi:hypothetical protein
VSVFVLDSYGVEEMTMGPDLLLLAVGGLLLVTGLLGGGFELRELKVPKVGKFARVLATAAGGVCILLGLGLHTLAEPTDQSAAATPTTASEHVAAPVHFSIADQLGDGQVSEQVAVIVDGRRAGVLTISMDYPGSEVDVTVDAPGRHDYPLDVTSVEADGTGGTYQYETSGQGTIEVHPGDVFQVVAAGSGAGRKVSLMAS